MIKSYNPNMGNAVHTVRITLMTFDYVGHIAYEITGNCKGASLLDAETCFECDTQDEIENYVENDCDLTWNEDKEFYSAVFTNENGNKLEIEAEIEEMQDMVVSIEFVKVRPEQNTEDEDE